MSNDNQPAPNPALREHVTSGVFSLTLRNTHIQALAAIGQQVTAPKIIGGGGVCHFVAAMRGLRARGLVAHRVHPSFVGSSGSSSNITDCYRLTKAGWAAYDLLIEAGIVPAATTASRRLVA